MTPLNEDTINAAMAKLRDRITELERSHQALAHDQLEIAKLLSDAGIEHSGFKAQAPRVQMLVERLRKSQENVIAFAKERNELRKRLNV